MAWLLADKESFLWVLRRERSEFLRLPVGAAEIGALVRELRGSVDPGAGALQSLGRRFPAEAAHELHARVFAPASPLLADASQVLLVLDGPLQSLPFSLLLEDLPRDAYRGFGDYRGWPWLVRRHAFTTLPSVAALRMLRRFARTSSGGAGFLGFGDPGLEGEGDQTRSVKIARLYAREAVADARLVRSLAPLPDTVDELRAMARSFGAPANAVRTRERATETVIKGMDLSGIRILAFSTHGLVADELKALAGGNYRGGGEPALVLTPPQRGTEQDDGLLTASEIARLKLDADWVILSACNTAASDGTPGAEGLSGLAKAFFYAGSRALLVSHWPVVSDAAVDLVTGAAAAAAGGAGKARAMQQAMLAMLGRTDKPHFAHPLFWAPFVVVGEGAAQETKVSAPRASTGRENR
jgi:CHAT domain-containing protein